jgi:hypothetical protein
VPTFVDRGVSRGQRGGSPTVVNISFLDRKLHIYLREAKWIPFQTHCYSENLVAPGIEPRTSVLAVRDSDHYTTEAVTFPYKHFIIYAARQTVNPHRTEYVTSGIFILVAYFPPLRKLNAIFVSLPKA